jgi:hypothetical protein
MLQRVGNVGYTIVLIEGVVCRFENLVGDACAVAVGIVAENSRAGIGVSDLVDQPAIGILK